LVSPDNDSRTYDPENPAHDKSTRDFLVVSDGSGHADGYGGASVFVQSRYRVPWIETVLLARTHTSVARMEHSALLMGLEIICETEKLYSAFKQPGFTRPTVIWLSDRQDLVLSTAGIYGRKANLDLWHTYGFFEQYLDVHAFYIHRATLATNRLVDAMAANGRALVKELANQLGETTYE